MTADLVRDQSLEFSHRCIVGSSAGPMSLPPTVRVKISSEHVESIGLSPVVSRDLPLEELVGHMLAVTGKDAARLREMLTRGSLVSGASRFRWSGLDVAEAEIAAFLNRFPESDPSIPFDASRCFQMVVHVASKQLAIERAAGEKRRLFRRRSFWGEVMALIDRPEYAEYSYRENADLYRWRPDSPGTVRLQEAARLLAFSTYEAQIRTGAVSIVDLYVKRK